MEHTNRQEMDAVVCFRNRNKYVRGNHGSIYRKPHQCLRCTELPFSVVKFDKSLLYSALKNKKTDRLINGIVPIIKTDNLSALVEGVEDDDQYEYSVGTGFEYVQGYKWAKPVPIMELKGYFNPL